MELFAHNETAYQSAVALMEQTGKAAVIHPTGTGKSFIAFHLALQHPNKRVCWLSPSEYIYQTQKENLSDANQGVLPQNIQFYTYAKLVLLTETELDSIKPDYIILDEFHRCGAQVWGQGVQRLLASYPMASVLGLSATNIRYLDNQRDMADELFDGNVASYITLGEALVRGILASPTYVQTVYAYHKSMEKLVGRVYRARNQAVRDKASKLLDALRRALEKAEGLDVIFQKHMPDKHGKYIVFCADKEHMDEMVDKAPQWFSLVDANPHVYQVYSEEPTAEKSFRAFKADESDHLKLLYCIDMLNEGIHVDDVGGVILIRPTASPIVYKQQIGRALQAGKRSQPVIFDIVNNFENLYSIGAIEEEMRDAISYYRQLDGEGLIVTENFCLVDEVSDCRQLFQQLEDALFASWEEMYGYAQSYYETCGNLEVPSHYRTEDGYSLGRWIQTQRQVRAGKTYGTLTEERIQLLDAIGMVWDGVRDAAWDKALQEARAYYAQHGNLNVKQDTVTPSGFRLGAWIGRLRLYRKRGICRSYLTEDRIQLLDEMNMIWDAIDYLWQRNYLAAKEYYQTNGHLDVPINYVTQDGIKLGSWIGNIRSAYQGINARPKPTPEQICQLESIGMNWESKLQRMWEAGFQQAQRYAREHGHLYVPRDFMTQDGYALGRWIQQQRDLRHLTDERRKRLEAIGMDWTTSHDRQWENTYTLVKQFYIRNGSLDMPKNHKEDGVNIWEWLSSQRKAYKAGKLSSERQQKLRQIGMLFPKNDI